MFIFNLAGATYRTTSAIAEVIALQPGTELALRRDPDNGYDSNAIEVCSMRTGAMLGFVPKYIATELAPLIDAGREDFVCVARRVFADKRPELMVDSRLSEKWLQYTPISGDGIPF